MTTKKDKDAVNDSEIKLTKRQILKCFDRFNEQYPGTPEAQIVADTANFLEISTQEVYIAVNERKTDDE